jgi:hypothetical protein
MKHSIAIGAAALFAAGGVVAVVAANPAHADTTCDPFGLKVVGDKYLVQNNRWNPPQKNPGNQCIDVTENGFKITAQPNSQPTNGPPVSYPSIYVGCHYNNCSPATILPRQVKLIRSADSAIDYTYVKNAIFDASYDIWLDPQPKKTGVNQTEVMIWLNYQPAQGSIQPIGKKQPNNVTIAGHDWQVWLGSNGQTKDVISYVAPVGISGMGFDVLEFLRYARNRGKFTDDFYLTSIQAGFEPWQGGVGLAVNSFRAIVTPGTGLEPAFPPTRRLQSAE